MGREVVKAPKEFELGKKEKKQEIEPVRSKAAIDLKEARGTIKRAMKKFRPRFEGGKK